MPRCTPFATTKRSRGAAWSAVIERPEPSLRHEPDRRSGDPAPARLLIRTTERHVFGDGLLARLLGWSHLLAGRPLHRSPPLTRVQVDDLQGRRLFASDEGRSRIEVTLPPETYHVTIWLGGLQRRYTVSLEQGATFDLHLALDADADGR